MNEFERIVNLLTQEEGVVLGKMMSSPGLKFNDKVFAFYFDQKMCFKLGTSKTLEDLKISYDLLNPFKTKPPLKGWYIVDDTFVDHWGLLAQEALERMRMKK